MHAAKPSTRQTDIFRTNWNKSARRILQQSFAFGIFSATIQTLLTQKRQSDTLFPNVRLGVILNSDSVCIRNATICVARLL